MEPVEAAVREIPNDRIKVLEMYQRFDFQVHVNDRERFVREHMIRDLGFEIAKKLFEYHKVLITQDEATLSYHARVEVIVPKEPPCPA